MWIVFALDAGIPQDVYRDVARVGTEFLVEKNFWRILAGSSPTCLVGVWKM